MSDIRVQPPDCPTRVNRSSVLVLLSQTVAGFVEQNLCYLARFTFQRVEGLRWVCQNPATRHRGFRRTSRV